MTLLGAIADDLTGATDLANALAKGGMRTVLLVGPAKERAIPDADAVVIALKSRSVAAAAAVEMSLEALRELEHLGVRQVFFKYCSTFDSTPDGNIGSVAEALLAALDQDFTIFCPAFPENSRTVYQGHLFVGDRLLSESGMESHPLTPMRDPDLVRVLRRQSTSPVGLVTFAQVRSGATAIHSGFRELRSKGIRLAVVDAIANADLIAIGQAAADLRLVTGGSGLALGLPENFRKAGLLHPVDEKDRGAWPIDGAAAIVSGSCSRATNEQVAVFRKTHPVFDFDPLRMAEGENLIGAALDWAEPRLGDEPLLISATAGRDSVQAAQSQMGVTVGELIEQALARIAKGLVERGVRRLVVAGGETSGAVVRTLDVGILRVGRQISPGVPWMVSSGPAPLALALKSGNFGGANFFLDAFQSNP